MPIYEGKTGFVELQRTSLEYALTTTLDTGDVNTSRKRFSVDFAAGNIITGDKIEISTKDGSTLELVNGHSYPDGSWFVHVDDVGGMRLYNTFAHAISGGASNALTLVAPSSSKEILLKARNTSYRPLARVESFDFTTQREQVQIGLLGEEFQRQYEAGRISGQGSMSCLWEHRYVATDSDYSTNQEFAAYLARLVLRIQQGADFLGRFFVYRESVGSTNNVWYEVEGQVTSCVVTVPNVGIVKTNIDFVTSGSFQLKVGSTPGFLLQESTDYLLQEDGSKIFLEDDAT
tara:strand:+ start:2032 stop:2898 length:867 start_codon:yes stop_codon:yes gene_type:complete